MEISNNSTNYIEMSSESHDDDHNQNDIDDVGYNVPKDHIVANREPMELPSSSSHLHEPTKERQRAANFKYDYASDAVELSLKSNERRSE